MQVHWDPSPVATVLVPQVGRRNVADIAVSMLRRTGSASMTMRSSSTGSSAFRRRSSTLFA